MSMSMVGYGFYPTDEELVGYYMKEKMLGNDHLVNQIPEVNICNYDPWHLPGWAPDGLDRYLFSPRNYKYANSKRANRQTKSGYWKVTATDREIRTKSTGQKIGERKTLTFYRGCFPKGARTEWVMHEYNATFNFPNQRDFVLCKLKYKSDNDMPPIEGGESSSLVATASKVNASEPEDPEIQAQLKSFIGYNEEDYSLNFVSTSQMYPEGSSSNYGFDAYASLNQFYRHD